MAGLYRKTASGLAEVSARRLALERRARTLLILCNGKLDEAALAKQLGAPVTEALESLCSLGLLETIPGSTPTAAPPPPPPPTEESDRLKAIVRRAWQELGPLFGSGTDERIAPLLKARDLRQMRRALDDLRDTMAIYRGRKAAQVLIQRIEFGD